MLRSPANRPAVAGLCCLTFLITLSSLSSAQQFTPADSTNAKQFAGVWKGEFHGSPFVTVTIGFEGNKLVGSVSHADVELNDAGELTKAAAGNGANPISSAQVNGNILRITAASDDGSGDSIHCELRLVANNEGSLRMLVPPEVVPRPKPWPLSRVSAKP